MATITEDYVSFETAKLLKEKGFSENTICKYADVGGITEKWYDDYRERVLRFDWKEGYLIEPPMKPKDQYEIIGDTILAPTHQMARKWLKEAHNIIIEPHSVWDGKKWEYQLFIVTPQNAASPYYEHNPYKSYEECVEAGIKYCLENLI